MYSDLFAKNGLTLDRLYALVLLREKGSLIQSAGGDPVRQSQLSRHLKDLASFFELELVERAGKSLKLTRAGEELADMAAKHFEELTKFRGRVLKLPKTVVIAAEANLLESTVSPVAGKLNRPSERCVFDLKSLHVPKIVEGIIEQTISLGLIPKSSVVKGVESETVFKLEYGVFVPDRLAPKQGLLTLKRALLECPHVIDRSEETLKQGLEKIAKNLRGEFKTSMVCNSQAQCVAAVKSGYYASVLPLSIGETFNGDSLQIVEDPQFDSLGCLMVLAWNKRHLLVNPHVAPIRESLQNFCSVEKIKDL